MNTRSAFRVFIAVALLASIHPTTAQQITITATPDGSLSWLGAALGTTSQVQQAYSLTGNTWSNLFSIKVTNNAMNVVVPTVSTSSPSLFYRVAGIPAPIPLLILTPDSGPPGTRVNVQLSGFPAKAFIGIHYAHSEYATLDTDANGNGTTSFGVPATNPSGNQTVTATMGSSATDIITSASFDQTAGLVLAPNFGPKGLTITLWAGGFLPYENIRIYYNGTLYNNNTVTANPTGGMSSYLTIPDGQLTNTVTALGITSGLSFSAPFYQTGSLSLSPSSGPPGTNVTAQFSNYLAGEQINVYYDGVLCAITNADSSGSGGASFTVPSGEPPGTNIVTAVGVTSGLSASNRFIQTALLLLIPNSGPPGRLLTVQLSGFLPNEMIGLLYGSSLLGGTFSNSVAADTNGNASDAFTVPFTAPGGNVPCTVTGVTSRIKLSAFFSETTGLVLTPSSGPVGSRVIAQLEGFQDNEQIQIYYAGVLNETTGVTSGSATVYVTIPAGQPTGTNTVSAVGVSSGFSGSTTFDQTP
jgi:hypothetical protein